jgi:hypothetical protein
MRAALYPVVPISRTRAPGPIPAWSIMRACSHAALIEDKVTPSESFLFRTMSPW